MFAMLTNTPVEYQLPAAKQPLNNKETYQKWMYS
jgi:hypothetical protein